LFRRPCKLRIGAFTDKRQLSNHGILAHEWMRIAGIAESQRVEFVQSLVMNSVARQINIGAGFLNDVSESFCRRAVEFLRFFEARESTRRQAAAALDAGEMFLIAVFYGNES